MATQSHIDLPIGIGWQLGCQTVQSIALSMSFSCPAAFRDLINEETQKFISQNAPKVDAEAQQRVDQRRQLIAKITAICYAGQMTRSHAEIGAEILQTTREFCQTNPLTADCCAAGLSLLNRLSIMSLSR
jgi:hypothetical protein